MRARRLRRALAALLAVAGLFVPFIVGVPTAYDGEPVFVAIPVEHVNTLIGTGTGAAIVGEINNFPGASVPFGMVQYSPDTVDNYAGYDYDNPHSTGFSMTHASVGCPAFGDISMLPTTTRSARSRGAPGRRSPTTTPRSACPATTPYGSPVPG